MNELIDIAWSTAQLAVMYLLLAYVFVNLLVKK